ncbi:MAG: hypothetical protein AAF196_02170 [Planctomycetota bacterium]
MSDYDESQPKAEALIVRGAPERNEAADPVWIDGLGRAIRKLSSQTKRLAPWHEELRIDDLRDRAA